MSDNPIAKLVTFALMCLVLLPVLAQQRGVSREEQRSYQVNGTPNVRINNFDGPIRIEAWDSNQVSYTAELRGRDQAALDRIEFESSQNGNQILINARLRDRNWNSWTSVSITVRVPRQTDLFARTGDGHIEARGVAGEVELGTGDGHIEATNLSGNLNLHTGDGHMTLSDLRGRLRARTGDGSINVRGRFEGLEATTGDGSMEIVVERGSTVASDWNLRTGDGSIQIALPDDLSAEIEANSNDGKISSDLPLMVFGKIGSKALKGRLNAGGKLLSLSTGDGPITLHRN
ncbi:MAG TPA: DUF4097 family beta strand repeat-containing protein [Blastocatellia bacterium]|nr:DUF4097 family beta strand repeat-containing protein [Blastocatellia bacterium]